MAFRAILDSQVELAKRLTTLALTAARKADAEDVKKEATLLLVALEQPISDRLREKARQFLSKGASTAPDAAVPNPMSPGDAAKDASPIAKPDEKANPGTTSADFADDRRMRRLPISAGKSWDQPSSHVVSKRATFSRNLRLLCTRSSAGHSTALRANLLPSDTVTPRIWPNSHTHPTGPFLFGTSRRRIRGFS